MPRVSIGRVADRQACHLDPLFSGLNPHDVIMKEIERVKLTGMLQKQEGLEKKKPWTLCSV